MTIILKNYSYCKWNGALLCSENRTVSSSSNVYNIIASLGAHTLRGYWCAPEPPFSPALCWLLSFSSSSSLSLWSSAFSGTTFGITLGAVRVCFEIAQSHDPVLIGKTERVCSCVAIVLRAIYEDHPVGVAEAVVVAAIGRRAGFFIIISFAVESFGSLVTPSLVQFRNIVLRPVSPLHIFQ